MCSNRKYYHTRKRVTSSNYLCARFTKDPTRGLVGSVTLQTIAGDKWGEPLRFKPPDLEFILDFIERRVVRRYGDQGNGVIKLMRIQNHLLITSLKDVPAAIRGPASHLTWFTSLIREAIETIKAPF